MIRACVPRIARSGARRHNATQPPAELMALDQKCCNCKRAGVWRFWSVALSLQTGFRGALAIQICEFVKLITLCDRRTFVDPESTHKGDYE
jgi:hypothetical protein